MDARGRSGIHTQTILGKYSEQILWKSDWGRPQLIQTAGQSARPLEAPEPHLAIPLYNGASSSLVVLSSDSLGMGGLLRLVKARREVLLPVQLLGLAFVFLALLGL